MATLPSVFRRSSDLTPTYDFQELVSQRGYASFQGVVQYFPASSRKPYTDGQYQYKLLPSSLASVYSYYTNALTSSTSTSSTINFETNEFSDTRKIKGLAVINFLCKNNVASTTNCYFSARLYKIAIDGSTATALTDEQFLDFDGNTSPASAMGASASAEFLAFVNVDSLIIKGEKLRLQIKLVDYDAENISIYHDPLGRDLVSNTNYSTQLKLLIPFDLETI